MTRALYLFLQIAVVVAVAVALAKYPGRIAVDWQGWRIDLSVGILVFIVAALIVLAAIVSRFWGAIRRAPGQFLESRRINRRQRGYKALTQGMVAVAAGDVQEARRAARKADALLDEPPLTMLLSAQAAQLGGEETAARRYFEAMLDHPDTAFLGVRGLLMQAIKTGDKAEALRLAERAYKLRPETAWVVDQLFELQVESALWSDANETIATAIRRKTLPAGDARRRRAAVLVEHSRLAEAEGDLDTALSRAREAHDLDPGLVPATLALARLFKTRDRAARAVRLIEEAWARGPTPELASAYGALIEDTDPLARVKRFQRLFSFRPDHRESHIALAEASLVARLWGEARKHLSGAAGNAPTARVCRLMAELEELESGDMAASRQWLARATTAVPDEAWVCNGCGAVSGSWSALCGNCNAFGSLAWQPPPRAVRLSAPATAPNRGRQLEHRAALSPKQGSAKPPAPA
ncbi:MAG: heme biosynthesis protein HemY [Alphaproteobacteria bacterium]|nr:heme biosynthesis protein HemY [Alphaproteobacteria bacterium]